MRPLADLAADLEAGRTTSRALTDAALARIADPAGEGGRAFMAVHADRARATADAMDVLCRQGIRLSPLMGLPISVKDLCDEAGEVTRAGSVVLDDAPPAAADAPIVARLRRAGAVIVGRTNMTEFAFSGIGANPHHGTPRNPWDRATGRIPGGSSSGAAVSVTDGMAAAAIGSDTGGSVRIPAALCGLAGLKPTARRVPLDGIFPLSFSLDSVGPLAPTIRCCALVDQAIADDGAPPPEAMPVAGLRLGVLRSYVMDGVDETVGRAYEAALSRLAEAGARLIDLRMPELDDIPALNAKGGFAASEAYALHRRTLEKDGGRYDPIIHSRILRGRDMAAADYIDVMRGRRALIARAARSTAPFDAVVMPTCPIVAPTIAEVSDPDGFTRKNVLILRNTTVGNLLDRCAVTIPCHEPGTAPVGVMLMGEHGADRRLLAMAMGVEGVVRATA